mgnify:CR=1 FL=1
MSVDPTKPHLGRVYDFMLGGHHNYEVDRQAAAAILKTVPSYPKWARLNRWFLQLVATQWEQAGRTHVLDLGSGLTTGGHFNELLPKAKILFSDIDPLTVAYGTDLLKGQPNMKYVQIDAADPQAVLAQVESYFGGNRQLAVGCIGVAYLIPDEPLHRLMQALHSYCAPGSVLACTSIEWREGHEPTARGSEQAETIQRHTGSGPVVRTRSGQQALFAPWKVVAVRSLTDWLNVPDMFSAEELSNMDAQLTGWTLER